MARYFTVALLGIGLAAAHIATAAAVDDIKLEIGRDLCERPGANDKNFVVYATNSNPNRSIDAAFKYDSIPAQQRFILFDANLNPITDKFPKFHSRRLKPRETAQVGCSYTYRASPAPPRPLSVPMVITMKSAAYVDADAAEAAPEDARPYAAFLLQGGIDECGAGAKPPGLFYLVNLHPYARLTASMNLLDDHGARVGVSTADLAPLSTARSGCSNGSSKPGPITVAGLAATAGLEAPPSVATISPPASASQTKAPSAERRDAQSADAPLSLGVIQRTQNVCAGPVAAGWIKINDAWNPTVCGKPPTVAFNVWTVQQLSDQPSGAVIYACAGEVPAGWVMVSTAWNPTVCGHPNTNQANVMAIRRMN